MNAFTMPIAEQIWDMKYRMKTAAGEPIDLTVQDTWRRIAKALAEAEEPTVTESGQQRRAKFEAEFYAALEGFQYLPAGRIVAGAGTARTVTLFNCLAGDTLIPTIEYGLVAIGEIVGETVQVLDGNGHWIESPINSFGEQEVAPVTLRGGYNGREIKIIRATAGHRWILDDESERTTDTLQPGQVLKFVKRQSLKGAVEYKAGVQHGIIYGDGSLERKDSGGFSTFRVRLCGSKVELAGWFDGNGFSITNPPSFEDDPLVRMTGVKTDLKKLPERWHNEAYISGFLHGWLATDGCVSRGQALLSCGSYEMEWLKCYGTIAGLEVSSATKLTDETNFGHRTKALFNVKFHRATMIPEDFLLAKHRTAFGQTPDYPWVVESVGSYGDPEPVFCPRVVTTDSVQLDLGIHTGQCFVMGTIPDSMAGIFENLKEAGLTMQQGGGIGYDFSTIRPKGALVKGVAADASGPLSFMDCWDSMCRTVMSAGSRRGAMMATMRCDHPDIEAFIEAKRDPLKLRMFNMSVLVTDEFMEAVKARAPWRLHFENRHGETLLERTVDAAELWDKIMKSTYDYAEPGVIFIDRINAANNLNYCEKIASTNPCGEQPLPPYGACLLGSINLPTLIENAFTKNAGLDQIKLKKLVATAVRMMDNVVDVSNFPLPQQAEEAKAKRRIGLGITGLADALIMRGLVYGSPEAVKFTDLVTKLVAVAAYEASVELAIEKGPFPLFDAEKFLAPGTFASTLPDPLKAKIRKHGIRNSHLTSIAPTGTISLYAGNVSSGIEPVFALEYDRKVLQPDGTKTTETVQDYAVKAYRSYWETMPSGPDGKPDWSSDLLPDYFVTAQTLSPMDHVRMQAAAQRWIDSSISKTVNLPEDISFEDFKAVYEAAYEMGCKGCTTYRPNDVTGSILSVTEKPKEAPAEGMEPAKEEPPVERPDTLPGAVYKLKWPGSDHALYITVTDILGDDGKRRPFEVFINSKNMEHFAWTVALTRMISAIFRRPHDSRFVVEELKAVFDPKGGAWVNGRYVPSVLAAIGGVIETHMKRIGYMHDPELAAATDSIMDKLSERKIGMSPVMVAPYGSVPNSISVSHPVGPCCSSCNSFNVKSEGGCFVCKDCGHSTCG